MPPWPRGDPPIASGTDDSIQSHAHADDGQEENQEIRIARFPAGSRHDPQRKKSRCRCVQCLACPVLSRCLEVPLLGSPRDPTLLVLLSRRLDVTPLPFCMRLEGLVWALQLPLRSWVAATGLLRNKQCHPNATRGLLPSL